MTKHKEYWNGNADYGQIVVAAFLSERLADLRDYLSKRPKQDETAVFWWLQKVQAERDMTKMRFLAMERNANTAGLDKWRLELKKEREEACMAAYRSKQKDSAR